MLSPLQSRADKLVDPPCLSCRIRMWAAHESVPRHCYGFLCNQRRNLGSPCELQLVTAPRNAAEIGVTKACGHRLCRRSVGLPTTVSVRTLIALRRGSNLQPPLLFGELREVFMVPAAIGLETADRLTTAPTNVTDPDRLAALLTATPGLRAQFFSNPMRAVGSSLPPPKYWNYGKPGWEKWLPWFWYRPLLYRQERRDLAKAVFEKVSGEVVDQTLASSINTDSVFEEFFAPVVKVSQRSYSSVYILSWAAFFIGISLIAIGTYFAINPPANVNATVVASVFGGSGAISALGSVYGMAVSGIRQATSDLSRTRLVLTAFSTQLGQLRALYEDSSTKKKVPTVAAVEDLNSAISTALTGALAGIPEAGATASGK